MRIAVLFDGGGLARLGLEQAGHECTGFEIDPVKHYLSQFVGSGRSVLADVTRYNFNDFDAVWASPPCQRRSAARTQGEPVSPYADELVNWSLSLSRTRFFGLNVSRRGGGNWTVGVRSTTRRNSRRNRARTEHESSEEGFRPRPCFVPTRVVSRECLRQSPQRNGGVAPRTSGELPGSMAGG